MADMYAVKKETLDNIANAIRTKRDITDGISVDDMAMQIGLISGGSSNFLEIPIYGSASPIQKFTITHNRGKVEPFMCYCKAKDYYDNTRIDYCFVDVPFIREWLLDNEYSNIPQSAFSFSLASNVAINNTMRTNIIITNDESISPTTNNRVVMTPNSIKVYTQSSIPLEMDCKVVFLGDLFGEVIYPNEIE